MASRQGAPRSKPTIRRSPRLHIDTGPADLRRTVAPPARHQGHADHAHPHRGNPRARNLTSQAMVLADRVGLDSLTAAGPSRGWRLGCLRGGSGPSRAKPPTVGLRSGSMGEPFGADQTGCGGTPTANTRW